MNLTDEAIVCAVLGHGENGAVVRLLTPSNGLIAGYVRGGRSRKLRPILQPGNLVQATLRARVSEQMPAATLELIRSRAPLTLDRMGAAAIEWMTALTAATVPEGMAYEQVYAALSGLLEVMDHADDQRLWMAGLVRYELLLLEKLGFGLDLSECAATGVKDDLAFVSPKSSKAVSRAAGEPYAGRLLPLPAFLRGKGGTPSWDEIADGMKTTGHFLERDLMTGGWRSQMLSTRERLVSRVGGKLVEADAVSA